MSKVQEILNRLDFAELVSRRTSLKKVKADEYRGLSPFTNEKTPSFFVNNSSKTWWCFSLGSGGGVLDYVQRIEGLDKPEAIRFLAEIVGLDSEEQDEALKALSLALTFFKKGSKQAAEYMASRNFSEDVVKTYDLGFVGYQDDLIGYLRHHNISDSAIISSGLGYKSDSTGSVESRFKSRLMIPIRDTYGRLVSFTGRDVSGKSNAKYLHGPVTKYFQKRDIVWNLSNVRSKVIEEEMVVVCEGQMDAIAVTEAGLPAVAILGASISTEQLEIVSKLAPNVYLIYDSDAAGERGLLKAFKMAQEADVDSILYSVVLPGSSDPDEFIHENGVDEFRKYITSSKSDTSAIVQALIREHFSEGATKSAIAKKVLSDLKETFKQTFTYRSMDLIERIAQEFSLNQKELRDWIQKGSSFRGGNHTNKKIDNMAFPAPIYERRILYAVLDEPRNISYVKAEGISMGDFESFLVSKVLSHAKPEYDSAEYFDVLRDSLSEDEYYKTLEFFSLGIGDLDLESSVQVMKTKITHREKSASAPKSFLGRPTSHSENELKSVFKEILKYK